MKSNILITTDTQHINIYTHEQHIYTTHYIHIFKFIFIFESFPLFLSIRVRNQENSASLYIYLTIYLTIYPHLYLRFAPLGAALLVAVLLEVEVAPTPLLDETGFPIPVPVPRFRLLGLALILLHWGMCLSAAFSLYLLIQCGH